jgi:hypothetical protein
MAPVSAMRRAPAPHTFGGRRAFVDGAVPAVRAQPPGLIGRCVGGADLQRVDHVAMPGGVEAVARRQLDDAPPPSPLILHHLGVELARLVAAPHGRVEGDRVVQQHEVGQQPQAFEARQRILLTVLVGNSSEQRERWPNRSDSFCSSSSVRPA